MPRKSLLIVCALFAIALVVLFVNQADGQINGSLSPQLVVDGIAPFGLRWSDQQLLLSFVNSTTAGRGIALEEDEWFAFNINNNSLFTSNLWPLQPIVPSLIMENVQPNSPLFLSPNGRYLMYSPPSTQELDLLGGSLLEVFDSQNNSISSTNVRSGRSSGSIGSLDVIWGSDETFVVKTVPIYGGEPPFPIYNYVAINNLSANRLLSVFELQGKTFVVTKVFDVSSNGLQTLMVGGFIGEGNTFWAIWNVESPNTLTFIPETDLSAGNVLDAHFTTPEGNEFVFINDQGIIHFSTITGLQSVLSNQVSALNYREATFSSNAETLALSNETSVYWIDLRQALATPTPTPTPVFTIVQISPTPANPLILSEETRAWYNYTLTLSATLTGSECVTVRLEYFPPTPTNYAHVQTRVVRDPEIAWSTAQTLVFDANHTEYEVRIRARDDSTNLTGAVGRLGHRIIENEASGCTSAAGFVVNTVDASGMRLTGSPFSGGNDASAAADSRNVLVFTVEDND